MNTKMLKKPSFWIAILSAVKVITAAFGLEILDNSQIETIANGIAGIATVIGVAISHDKEKNEQ